MKNRIIFGSLAFVILIASTIFSDLIFLAGCFILSAMMIWELYHTLKLKINKLVLLVGFLILFMFSITEYTQIEWGIWLLASVLLIYYLFSDCTFSDISKTFMITIYIVLPMISLYYIRIMEYGEYLVWFALLGAVASDTFAIFVGKWFGKMKLFEKVSPKKTIAGSIGGIIGVIICFIAFAYIIAYQTGNVISYTQVVILAIISSVFSQLGDLVASRIKREHHRKDYGDIIPGHGGILDRCDSILLVAPVVFVWLTLLFDKLFI